MTEAETQAQLAVQSLRESVKEALERKRRLGEYMVIWRDGKPVRLTQTSPDLCKDDVHSAA